MEEAGREHYEEKAKNLSRLKLIFVSLAVILIYLANEHMQQEGILNLIWSIMFMLGSLLCAAEAIKVFFEKRKVNKINRGDVLV